MKYAGLFAAAALACGATEAADAALIYTFSGNASYQTNVGGNTGGSYVVTFAGGDAPSSGGPDYTYVYHLSASAVFTPYVPSSFNPIVGGDIAGDYTLLLRKDATTPAYYVDLLDSSANILWSIVGDASDVGQLDLSTTGSATPQTNIIDQNFINFTNGNYGLILVPQTFLTFSITDTGSAAPEPATWAMLIVGFGLVGATMRSVRRSTRIHFA